jgi:hypothetical protein
MTLDVAGLQNPAFLVVLLGFLMISGRLWTSPEVCQAHAAVAEGCMPLWRRP